MFERCIRIILAFSILLAQFSLLVPIAYAEDPEDDGTFDEFQVDERFTKPADPGKIDEDDFAVFDKKETKASLEKAEKGADKARKDRAAEEEAAKSGDPAASNERSSLRVYLSTPIGTENITYEETRCTALKERDDSSYNAYRIRDLDCDRKLVKKCEEVEHDAGKICEQKAAADKLTGVAKDNFVEECLKGTTSEAVEKIEYVYCRPVQVIQAESGAGLIKAYASLIYGWAAGTIGIVAVLVIVVSGIQIITSDISGDVDSAKSRIVESLSGLAILLLSAVILYTVNPNFFN